MGVDLYGDNVDLWSQEVVSLQCDPVLGDVVIEELQTCVPSLSCVAAFVAQILLPKPSTYECVESRTPRSVQVKLGHVDTLDL